MGDRTVSADEFQGIMVLTSTDHLPSLEADLADRKERGAARCDEWWDGVYVLVDVPAPEHGRLVMDVTMFLEPLVDRPMLGLGFGITIGEEDHDTRVPDVSVWRHDTLPHGAELLSAAELVVEILAGRERAGAKLDFYARWQVHEYLEIDAHGGTVRLLRRDGDDWVPTERSAVLGFRVEPGAIVAGDECLAVPVWAD